MEWIKIIWTNENENFPKEIFMEIADDRYNTRKVELFKDGKLGYAIGSIEKNGTMLNEQAFPSVEEYNRLNLLHSHPSDKDILHAINIDENEFEDLWRKANISNQI